MDDVAVFWDYENCPAPTNTSGYAIVQSIRSMAQTYGRVKSLKAYVGISEQFVVPKTQALRSELQCSGVSLVDCPHNGRKDVADKMMIVDMLAHAIDNPSPSTIILISGDRDFAYALSVLSLRCYRIILCTTSTAHMSLLCQASECLDWATICSAAVEISPPQWIASKSPVTSKIPIPRSNSQREVSAPPPGFRFSRDSKDEDASIPAPSEQKKPMFSFGSPVSVSKAFANPKSVPEFIPSSLKQTTLQWPIKTSSPKKSAPSLEKSRFKPEKGFKADEDESQAHDVVVETDEAGPVQPNIRIFGKVAGSSSARPLFSFGSQAIQDDDEGSQNPSSSGAASDGLDDTLNAPEDIQPTPQTPRTPSTIPLPEAHPSSSDHYNFVTPRLAPAFSMPTSSPAYKSNASGTNLFGAPKPQTSPKKYKYSAGVPSHFVILIKALQLQLREGRERVLRSQVGEQISHKGLTYQKAGVTTFSAYVAMAEMEGIVELGGSDGKAWIALASNWRTIYVA